VEILCDDFRQPSIRDLSGPVGRPTSLKSPQVN
jgi:hypothetical protein